LGPTPTPTPTPKYYYKIILILNSKFFFKTLIDSINYLNKLKNIYI